VLALVVPVGHCGGCPRRVGASFRCGPAACGAHESCDHAHEGSNPLAFSKQPSYLKRQKEQQRVARANQKREERRARKNSKGAGGEQQESLDPALDGVEVEGEGVLSGNDTETQEPAAE